MLSTVGKLAQSAEREKEAASIAVGHKLLTICDFRHKLSILAEAQSPGLV